MLSQSVKFSKMFKMLVAWKVVIFSLLLSSSQACNPNETCIIDRTNENIENLLVSMDYFTTQLIQKLYKPNQTYSSPEVIAPMSLYVILVLLLFGSAGDTHKNLSQILKFPDGDLQQLKKSFGDIIIATDAKRSEIVNGKENIILEGHVAEGLFIQKDFTLVQDYADYLNALNIPTHPVDFINDMQGATNAVYGWINDNKPKSNSFAKSFSSSSNLQAYFTSLFYFTARWQNNLFLDKVPGLVPFHTLNNGGIVNVQMMKASTSLLHYDNKSSFSAVQIPYEWYDFAAVFILPNKEVDPVKFVADFKMDIMKEFLSNAEMKDIDCQIPTFSYTLSFGLNQPLGDLGIKDLFGEADLSKMLNIGKQNLGIQISHYIEIAVNEKGTTADNLVVEPVKKNPPTTNLIPFIADRPFLMLIRSTHSSAIVHANFYHGSSNTFFFTSSN